ncbi:MAG: SPOR domain-containing protein [Deltaproteobacteria bacterium]|nr:SPOR domain-containing protein [Deltaproteobacteria bacterium]
MVIGEKGSGKTTMLNQFLISAKGNWSTCRIRAHSTISGSPPSLDNLNEHQAFILPDDELPIVMFDDAHELTGIELQYLLKDALAPGGSRKLKRLILFCEPSINATMASLSAPFTKETVLNKVHMATLSETETHDYLFHRLKIAGLTGKNPFKSSDVKSIHKSAYGLPGIINEKAHTLLLSRLSGKKPTHRTTRLPRFKKSFLIIAGFIVVLSLVMFLFFFKEKKSNIPFEGITGPKIRVLNSRKKTSKKPPAPDVSSAPAVSSKGSEKTAQLLDKPDNKLSKTDPSVSLKSKVQAGKPKAQAEKKKIKSSDLIQKKKKQEKTVSDKAKRAKGIHRESWLLAQNPSYYTIQLIGLQNEKSIHKFVKKYKLINQVAYYKTLYHKKDWYPLLYGVYHSRKEASSAMKKLPQELRKFSPWIRTFSSIQQIIKSL